ncbi:hypothetical protein BKA00_004814 [Actinomadura coerulea]|uniref:Uncharacterized protein n=1 Tax=Actinomadura coerulea TaxID=46159 RepID=A0A7X0G3A6_9ACTN|nr:hypothetical protein [Actinomadura coerulea]MBB6397900.1 hypothetical protein [Actinomadura coerulea]GGQ19396.1 hypothetical protein GCM10010187_39720 [Actinomadura coerulea]
MSYPKPVFELPAVYGDNAAELEAEIQRLAGEFYGLGTKLALPHQYHAKLTTDRASTSKLYVVEGLIVRRHWSGWQNQLSRRADLPSVLADSAIEVEAEIERLTAEFFGSDADVTPCITTECKVRVVTDAKDGKKYESDGVTLTQMAKWPEA